MCEPQPVHHSPRGRVLRLIDADDAVEAARREPEVHRGGTGLRRQTIAPIRARQAPPDLDRRQDLGQEVRHRQTGPADHGAAGAIDQRLDPEAVAPVARNHALEELACLLLAHGGAQRVPPERLFPMDHCELVEIFGDEGPKDETLRRQRGDAGLCHGVSPTAARARRPGRGPGLDGRRPRRAAGAGRIAPIGPPACRRPPRPTPPRSRCFSRARRTPTTRRAGASPPPAPGRPAAARPIGCCGEVQPPAQVGRPPGVGGLPGVGGPPGVGEPPGPSGRRTSMPESRVRKPGNGASIGTLSTGWRGWLGA